MQITDGGISSMKRIGLVLSILVAAAPMLAVAQSLNYSSSVSALNADPMFAGGTATPSPVKHPPITSAPFSRVAIEGGVSLMGINLQAATNVSRNFNLRGTGNVFKYTVNNVNINGSGGSNGIDVSGNLNFATAGVSLDYYPFPMHGFRLSPGVMLYNQNNVSASGISAPGTSFTLDSQKYYSDSVNPLNVTANLGLNTHQQAFTLTTGWGNMIPRRGGHWSFPFEFGAVFTGVPTINIGLTGNACTSQADAATNGPSCVNMATNTTAQSNLSAQVAKYKNDLQPAIAYPIFSFGVAYAFHIR
jgi:hypothetical protein